MPDKPDKEQEHVEDYLELERYIEQLQTEHAAPLPENMTPEQVRIYRVAALFHTATPDATEPRPTFVSQLEARLLTQLQSPASDVPLPSTTLHEAGVDTQNQPTPSTDTPSQRERQGSSQSSERVETPTRRPALSRRRLLTGAAAVAASLGVGAGIGYTVERAGVQTGNTGSTGNSGGVQGSSYTPTPLVGNVPTTWLHVTSLVELDRGAVRFATNAVVGYVVHLVNDAEYADEIIAVSAACTHMGCIVQWQTADRRFHCPCHAGLFEASGEPANTANSPGHIRYLAPLPRLKTKIENGDVYVEVPL